MLYSQAERHIPIKCITFRLRAYIFYLFPVGFALAFALCSDNKRDGKQSCCDGFGIVRVYDDLCLCVSSLKLRYVLDSVQYLRRHHNASLILLRYGFLFPHLVLSSIFVLFFIFLVFCSFQCILPGFFISVFSASSLSCPLTVSVEQNFPLNSKLLTNTNKLP